MAWGAVALLAGATAQAFDLQGHRGARGLAPENTLPGFERALELGVTTLELDIAITSDGVLVIHHDPTLNPDTTRDAAGQWLAARGPAIHSLTWQELQRYDVGRLNPSRDYARRYPEQQPIDGARIPRLSELFDLVKRRGDDRVRFAIETKVTPDRPEETPAPDAFAKAVVAEIRKADLGRRSQILSFDWRTLQVVQEIAPEIPTVYLTAQQRWLDNVGADRPEGSRWTAGFQFRDHGSIPKMIKAAGGAYWSAYFGDLDAQKVEQAQSLGLKVLVWTVNDPVQMARMVAMGVDGLITDRPDLARAVLQQHGIRW
ncbi:MAG: glycerophosphodiester phosphodiesterase [Betaproteobacteria bacterium RIFCSPLOWO2_02_FULL_67_19]|nr:MAG: glycerophosphodiester phosphodiesterase [Betaproteobacteria bacterium RIFCSPLOWO2_02_FULL_67_19]